MECKMQFVNRVPFVAPSPLSFSSNDHQAQLGGKGSMRRKSAPVQKVSSVDDKKLAETARKAGLQELPVFDEANIILEDDSVIQMKTPKLYASMQHEMAGNTIVIVGQTSITQVSKLAVDMQGGPVAPGGAGMAPQPVEEDDMPDLGGGTFEAEDQD